nr:heavy metal-associated domain-containing protein [uncultured Carboxylicivirga sp.]
MKKLLVILFMAMMVFNINAKDKKKTAEVIFKVEMDCQGCVKKINKNLPFEKGVKGLTVDLERQKVTVNYREDKTNKEALKKAFEELGYKAVEIKEEENKADKAGNNHHNHQH